MSQQVLARLIRERNALEHNHNLLKNFLTSGTPLETAGETQVALMERQFNDMSALIQTLNLRIKDLSNVPSKA